ncbi:low temperature requirement protein A [Longispora albida]|uniref:low temperature requirement protein A n=1 Tax=Longispora albida TaxID=203523 RepID=UPI00036AD6C7|nr:low temperature requirement protein A [Longispora albida]
MNDRVSTLELFFDLVFVFTITQLTTSLVEGMNAAGLLRVLLMLAVIWWMYAGYAWVTNTVVIDNTLRRFMLIIGMSGFLLIGLAIPKAFGDAGVAFGVGYLVVNLVHTFLLAKGQGPRLKQVMLRLAPLNLASALLVLAGGLLPAEPWRYVLWLAAVVLQMSTPYLHRVEQGFAIRSEHFVERHGLVVIIALGESVIAIGVGAAGLPINVPLVAAAVLGLTLAYHLWWAYFGGDDTAAEHAMEHLTNPATRARAALNGFGYAHLPMLLGIVCMSAGVKKAIGHPTDHAYLSGALALAGGVALFLLGEVWFRRVLRIGTLRWRVLGAVAALCTVPVGLTVSALAQLALLPVVMAVMFTLEYGRIPRLSGPDPH